MSEIRRKNGFSSGTRSCSDHCHHHNDGNHNHYHDRSPGYMDAVLGLFLVAISGSDTGCETLDVILLRILPHVSTHEIYSMLAFSFGRAMEVCDPNTPVRIASHDPVFVDLIRYLQPDCSLDEIEIGTCRL